MADVWVTRPLLCVWAVWRSASPPYRAYSCHGFLGLHIDSRAVCGINRAERSGNPLAQAWGVQKRLVAPEHRVLACPTPADFTVTAHGINQAHLLYCRRSSSYEPWTNSC